MTNTNLQEKINEIIAEGYDVPISDFVSRGFKLFNENMGNFVIYTLVFFAISFLLSFIPIVGQIGSLFITPPLTAGFYLAAHKTRKEGGAELGTFFKGFDFFVPLIMRSLATMGIAIILMLPFILLIYNSDFAAWMTEYAATNDPTLLESFPGLPKWYAFITLIPLIYIGISYLFADMFILFNGAHFWDAMESSRRLITKNWFSVFFLAIVGGVIVMVGFLLCGVGALFTVPAYMCIVYLAFMTITKLDEGEEDDVTDHLIA